MKFFARQGEGGKHIFFVGVMSSILQGLIHLEKLGFQAFAGDECCFFFLVL